MEEGARVKRGLAVSADVSDPPAHYLSLRSSCWCKEGETNNTVFTTTDVCTALTTLLVVSLLWSVSCEGASIAASPASKVQRAGPLGLKLSVVSARRLSSAWTAPTRLNEVAVAEPAARTDEATSNSPEDLATSTSKRKVEHLYDSIGGCLAPSLDVHARGDRSADQVSGRAVRCNASPRRWRSIALDRSNRDMASSRVWSRATCTRAFAVASGCCCCGQ
jgi:hypothetical protein